MLPCLLHVNWINQLTWLINWLIHHKGSIDSWTIKIFKIHTHTHTQKIYEKFEEFLFKLVWRETLFQNKSNDTGGPKQIRSLFWVSKAYLKLGLAFFFSLI